MLATLLAAGLFGFSWYRHETFRSTMYDLAVFDQALWLMAHGKAPFVTLVGRNIFLDHLSPVLVLFVPLYWLAATPMWLFATQAVAIAIGLLAVGPLLQELRLSRGWRTAFLLAYVVSVPLWNAVLYDFHPTTLAVPFLLVGITAALRDQSRWLLGATVAILLMRADLGLAVVGVALVGFRSTERRWHRIGLVALAIAWVAVGSSLNIVKSSPLLWHAYYGHLGPNPAAALLAPWKSIPAFLAGIWRGDHFWTAVVWLMSLGFLPLLSPGRMGLASLWLLPLVGASSMLSQGGLHFYHYGAPVFPLLLLAAGSGAARVKLRVRPSLAVPCLGALAAATFLIVSPLRIWIFDARGPDPSEADRALHLVGPADGVTATDPLGSHLSHRQLLLAAPYPFAGGRANLPLAEEVVEVSAAAAARLDAVVIYRTQASGRALLESQLFRDFHLVFNEEGVLVYLREEG